MKTICAPLSLAAALFILGGGLAPAAIQVNNIDPTMTDPDIVAVTGDQGVVFRHVVAFDPDTAACGSLLVYLPGSGSRAAGAEDFLTHAASLGLRAIGLQYVNNQGTVLGDCVNEPDGGCFATLRSEVIYGNGVADSPFRDVDAANSIENRLRRLLEFLHAADPAQGWNNFLDVSGDPDWSRMILAGHSQGGGHAAFIAKQHPVARCVMFAGGDTWMYPDPDEPAPWLAAAGLTPPECYFGFTHLRDGLAFTSSTDPLTGVTAGPTQLAVWAALGISGFGPLVTVETETDPHYQFSHMLTTDLTPNTNPTRFHPSVVENLTTPRDGNGEPVFKPVWTYLLTGPKTANPLLSITPAQLDGFRVARLEAAGNLVVQRATRLGPASDWQSLLLPENVNNGAAEITVPALTDRAFFRLIAPARSIEDIPEGPGAYDLLVDFQGYARRVILFVPPGYDPNTPAPLVFALHGGGMSAGSFSSKHPDLIRKCAVEGMILAFPEGTPNPYDGCRLHFWTNLSQGWGVDDVAYFQHLLGLLQANFNIDPARIHAAGFSNGGVFAQRLVRDWPGVFASIAAVGSGLGYTDAETRLLVIPPPPPEPVSVLIVNSRLDCTRPWLGGLNELGNEVSSAAQMIDYWSNSLHCATAPAVVTRDPIPAPGIPARDCAGNAIMVSGHKVIISRWTGCDCGREFEFVELALAPHIWPDASDRHRTPPGMPAPLIGYDANLEVIEFFKRNPRPVKSPPPNGGGGPANFDFGDAPPPYPTRLADNGARHGFDPAWRMGASIDYEPDAVPDAMATGDDLNGYDDEDGVFLPVYVRRSHAETFRVHVSQSGFLDGWIDYHQDGDWQDAGDQILNTYAVTAGLNVIMLAVPPGASVGETYGRIRFSPAGGSSFEGAAERGEVEDFLIRIAPGNWPPAQGNPDLPPGG